MSLEDRREIPSAALEVRQLTKHYLPPPPWLRPLVRSAARQPVVALADVSFRVAFGEVVGLVGPNGAGKTTLIKILTTLLDPTSGSAAVGGIDVTTHAEEIRGRFGVVLSDDRGLYWRLTGQQNLEFFGVLSGLRMREATERAADLMDQVGLADRDKLVFGYSTGMRARLSLAVAQLGDPELLILDEPTRSLDPTASQEVLGMLRAFADRGGGVLLSSHRIAELIDVCDRIVVLTAGRVRFVGATEELAADASERTRALLTLLSQDGS